MRIGTVSESLEDYLLIIYQLIEESGKARVKEIAARKGVKMSSVTAALKRLAREKLVLYSARDNVEITSEGGALVRRLLHRRDQVRRFLNKILQVPLDLALEDAGGIEHHVSLETLDRLSAFQGFLEDSSLSELDLPSQFAAYYNQCLLASPEPAAVCQEPSFPRKGVSEQTLLDLAPGERGVILKLLAHSAIRQRLVDMGFLPNVEILMERVAPLGDPIEVKIKGFHISLRKEEASRILIKRIMTLTPTIPEDN